MYDTLNVLENIWYDCVTDGEHAWFTQPAQGTWVTYVSEDDRWFAHSPVSCE